MRALFWLAVVCIGLCSCKRDGFLSKERKGEIEVGSFLVTEIEKYGGKRLPSAPNKKGDGFTDYVFVEDQDRVQVACEGNHVATLLGTLRPHLGDPALVRTNAAGLTAFAYTTRQAGVAINCGLNVRLTQGTNQEVTHLVLARVAPRK